MYKNLALGALLLALALLAIAAWSPSGPARESLRSASLFTVADFPADYVDEATPSSPAAQAGKQVTSREESPRRVVRTASMVLAVEDVPTIARTIRGWAQEHGGFVASSEVRDTDGGRQAGKLTLRVPEASLDAAMDQLRSLADRVVREESRGEDVTHQMVDLEARLRNLRAAEEEMRTIMREARKKTGSTAEVLRVHQEVNRLRDQIERLQAQSDTLSDRAAMATLVLELLPRDTSGGPVVAGWSFSAQWVSAWRVLTWGLQRLGTAMAYGVTLGLPAIMLIVPPVWAFRRWRSRVFATPQTPMQ
ncbi:MAG: DUF4349 domain-containing protein [Planctomycetota bacterium]